MILIIYESNEVDLGQDSEGPVIVTVADEVRAVEDVTISTSFCCRLEIL